MLLASNPGAPVNIYLNFDGHSETSVAWNDQRRDGGSGAIVTPNFSADGDLTGFSQADIDRITEIFQRVAEDFRPFDINVTTFDPPANLGIGRDLLVVVGGDGAWTIAPGETVPRYIAVPNSYSTPTVGNNDDTQTLFVFQQPHAGLGGRVPQNIANSVSAGIAVAMGLEVHESAPGVPLEGNASVGPILGDTIIGIDTTTSNPNSLRDVWFDAAGTSTASQDDIALIAGNPNVRIRTDDIGNTTSSATGISVGNGPETFGGIIERSNDVDVFSFTTAATTGTLTVAGLDLRTAFNAITPGSNLLPTLRLRDSSGTIIGTGTVNGLQSTLTFTVPDGTYYAEILTDGSYGNLGEYTVTMTGVDQLPLFSNPVQLNSNPGAPVTLYLAFAGDNIPVGSDILTGRTDGGSGPVTTAPYNTDGNLGGFSATEIDQITEIWARVAEDFKPFDVNVTTVPPGSLQDRLAMQVSIGDNGAFLGRPPFAASLGAFSDPNLENAGYVFQTGVSNPKTLAYRVSAAFGTMLGLENHPRYIGSFQVQNFDPGTTAVGPIMGAPNSSLRDIWVNAAGPFGAGTLQNDLAIITDSATNGITFRVDDHGSVLTQATRIAVGVGDEVLKGIIGRNGDVDLFRFDTLSTTATISLTGLDLRTQFTTVSNPGTNLDPILTLLDANGNIIAQDDPANSLKAQLTQTLPAGTFYIQVSTDGSYGNLGEYTVTLSGVDVNPVTISIDPSTFAENSGTQTAVGRVNRPGGALFGSPLVVQLTSSDTTEVTVPASVTIPASAGFATFDITLVDDTLLDGDQLVGIQTTVQGVINSEAFITVTDVESLDITVTPSPVAENAGTALVTVSRSNTDVDAANHWVTVNDELVEYTADGTLVQSIPVEWPPAIGNRPSNEHVHDVIVMQDGQIAVYNGTTGGWLSIYNLNTAAWRHIGPIAGLSNSSFDLSTGGISSFGKYVFLSDVDSFTGDEHGIIRVDTATGEIVRFGDRIVGARLFALASSVFSGGGGSRDIYELDPSTGELINTLTLQRAADAIAFDGTFLWAVIRGDSQNAFVDELLKIDPSTGFIFETHPLSVLQNSQFEGMAYLNGNLYLVDNQGDASFELTIESYDPANRRPSGAILEVELLAGFVELGSFVGSLPSANRLIATSQLFDDLVYLIDPNSGQITSSFFASAGIDPDTTSIIYGTGPGITSVSDVVLGGVTYGELIYIKRQAGFDVYLPDGTRIDADPSTPGQIDQIPLGVQFDGDFTAADVPDVIAGEPSYRDLSIGFDGLVYGLLDNGTEIAVYDAVTLKRIRGIALDRAVTTIAVGDSSGIYAGTDTGDIVHFDNDGVTLSIIATSFGPVSDIEVNAGREVLFSTATGVVIHTTIDEIQAGDLSAAETLESTGGLTFVSFGRHPTRSTGNLVVTLSSSDITEFALPDTVIIPAGQQSVTFDAQVIDDNVRDGDQAVTLSGAANEYQPASTALVVTDVENVGISVIPAEVQEGSGLLSNTVEVYRTDVDGPFDNLSSFELSVTDPQPIVDHAVTLSHLTVPSEVSRITDVNVTLNITHDAIPDLDVFLISPAGTRVELFTDLSSNGSRFSNTILDDQAAVRIVDASAPYTGRLIPEQALANFIGENPSGTWRLEVIDDSTGDAGILLNWTLSISTIGLAPLTVNISSSDPTEADVTVTTVTIPANQSSILIPLDVPDDLLVDGTQTVTISADQNSISLPGFIAANDTVDVLDSESLLVVVDQNVVSEGAGIGALNVTVTRSDSTGPLVLTVASSDTTELAVPGTVTIPDGELSVTFAVDAVDDLEFDGAQHVTIAISAPGFVTTDSEVITVTDQEARLTLTTLTPVVAEDAGTITFTIARLDVTDLSVAQPIALTSSDTSELIVPASVIILPGEFSATFEATVVGDGLLDGSQIVTVTAADGNGVTGISPISLDVTIEDAEFVSITVPTGSESVLENLGADVLKGTVSVSTTGHTSPIIVTLANSDLTELSIPAQVIIPVGETSAEFPITVLDDPLIDHDQHVTITGQVAGYRDGVLVITVRDHEPPRPMSPVNNTVDPTPVFAWEAVTGATRYDLWVNDVSRNIVQLFRLENLPAAAPLFSDGFESADFSETRWATFDTNTTDDTVTTDDTYAEVDGLAPGRTGNFAAHLNGNPNGGDTLQSVAIDLAGQVGATLKYSWERTGGLTSPEAGHDLIVSYRNAAGQWVFLDKQVAVGDDMTVFNTAVVRLPEAALHSNFAFRFTTTGVPDAEDPTATVDDWFIDDVEISAFEKFEPTQEMGVGQIRWWVRAYDDLERPGFWSTSQNFNIRTAPQFTAPSISGTQAQSGFPELSWTSIVDSARYDLWINNTTTGEIQIVREQNLQTTSFASATADLPGGSYTAWVRAIGPDGFAGNWSRATRFTVLQTPKNIGPSGATFDRTPEIRWDAVDGAKVYDVWVSKRVPGATATVVLRDQFVSGTTRIPETDLADGNYVVWVEPSLPTERSLPGRHPSRSQSGGADNHNTAAGQFDIRTSSVPVVRHCSKRSLRVVGEQRRWHARDLRNQRAGNLVHGDQFSACWFISCLGSSCQRNGRTVSLERPG
ncbi:MAG: proprotein convertase P-domain-containing protein [Planctomycetaceae bacterium]